jgi:hypothetical protein
VTCGWLQRFDNAYGKGAFLGVANPQWSVVGMDDELAIDDPHALITMWVLGGEFITELNNTPSLRKAPLPETAPLQPARRRLLP